MCSKQSAMYKHKSFIITSAMMFKKRSFLIHRKKLYKVTCALGPSLLKRYRSSERFKERRQRQQEHQTLRHTL